MASFTKTYHRTTYSSISPSSPKLTQACRTVLIVGASSGIGFSIASAFIQAQASCIILLGRSAERLEAAVADLKASHNTKTELIPRQCDVSSKESMDNLWKELEERDTAVHVMVLNAAHTGATKDVEEGVSVFETNICANLRALDAFAKQGPKKGKVLLYISSMAAHMNPYPSHPHYAASKAGYASLVQHLADETPVEEMQMISIHPGAVLTPSARKAGFDESSAPWDDAQLPASFCVWASTQAAAFLHGRFVWANWDVEELMAMRDRVLSDPGFLKIGLQGVEHVAFPTIFKKIVEKTGMRAW